MIQRRTMQKEVIFKALCSLRNHPTADGVYDYIHPDYPNISRATVYRVLNQLASNGQINKVSVFNGADCFDHNVTPHSHGRCTRYQRIFDVPYQKPPVETFMAWDSEEFSITDYSLQFDGLCRSCREAV